MELYCGEKDAALQESQHNVTELSLLLRVKEKSSNLAAEAHQRQVAEVERKTEEEVEWFRVRYQSLCEDTAREAAMEGE